MLRLLLTIISTHIYEITTPTVAGEEEGGGGAGVRHACYIGDFLAMQADEPGKKDQKRFKVRHLRVCTSLVYMHTCIAHVSVYSVHLCIYIYTYVLAMQPDEPGENDDFFCQGAMYTYTSNMYILNMYMVDVYTKNMYIVEVYTYRVAKVYKTP